MKENPNHSKTAWRPYRDDESESESGSEVADDPTVGISGQLDSVHV